MALGGERARLVGEDARDQGRELDRPPRRVARAVAGPARGADRCVLGATTGLVRRAVEHVVLEHTDEHARVRPCETGRVPPERVRTGPSMIVHGAESPAPEPRKSCKLLGTSIARMSSNA